MTLALLLNGFQIGMVLFAVAAMLVRLVRGRGAYLVALFLFFAATTAPLFVTLRPGTARQFEVPYQPTLQVKSRAPLLSLLWLSGSVVLLAREAIGHYRLRKLRGSPLTPQERFRLGWPGDDDRIARVSDGIQPMTVGLLRPRVLVPAELLDQDITPVLRAIIRHERSHLRWRDPLWNAMVRVVLACFWTALPLWFFERLIRREREAAADRDAVQAEDVAAAQAYAEMLVAFARRRPAPATAVGFGSDLEHRVRRLFALPCTRTTLAVTAAAITGAAFALPCLPIVGFESGLINRNKIERAWPASQEPKNETRGDPAHHRPAGIGSTSLTNQSPTFRTKVQPLPAGSDLVSTIASAPGLIPAAIQQPPASLRELRGAEQEPRAVTGNPVHSNIEIHRAVRRHVTRIRN